MDQALILSAVISAGALVGTIAGRVLKARAPKPEVVPDVEPEVQHIDLERLLAVYEPSPHAA